VSYLRRVFAPTGEQPIQTRGSGYCLRFDPGDVDAFRFERLLGDARQVLGRGDPRALPQAADLLGEALTLWRGHPLVELSGSEDVVSEVARLEEMHLAALELRAEVTLGLGRTDHALAELRGLVADHPLRERLHELLMVALYRSGRQG
jgi:DNA-binding SARP family transcriptional activator